MIMNPPSAWAVAKRDAPQVAEQCWTHGFPVGPKGRFAPFLPYFWSIWNFSKNKEAAKSLLAHLSQPASIEKLVAASGGYDLPAFEKLTTLKTWAEEGPPKGTLYHYPNPLQASDAVDRRVAGAAEDRPADLYAGHPDQNVRALSTRAKRWKRRWPGRKANAKASCGADARISPRRPRSNCVAAAASIRCLMRSRRRRMPASRRPRNPTVEMKRARKMHHG